MKQRFKSVTRTVTGSGSGRQVAGTRAVTRAVAILRAFSDTHPEWGLAELSRALGISKPTALRLLRALEQEGLVVHDEPSGAYRLGPTIIELGARALRANDLSGAARVELDRLARATGETCSLEILVGDETLILDEVQGRYRIATSPCIGTRWPAHATSTGKVLLAAALADDPGRIRRMTKGRAQLSRATPKTIVSPVRLKTELGRVLAQGYAAAIEELETGYVALGAAVRNHEGLVVAAISVAGPTTRFTATKIPKLVEPLRLAAERISRRLGWRPNIG